MVYTLPPLPYAYDALEPYLDARTMELHHGKHHATYVASLNKAIEHYDLGHPTIEDLVAAIDTLPQEIRAAVRNHGGGHANHSLFWTILRVHGGKVPQADLRKAIDEQLGGFDRLKEQLIKAALGRFGSGWAWLSVNAARKLVVEDTPNQNSPHMHGNTPILGIDVWEHAYYLKYQNRRADYLAAFFNVIDWNAVGQRYADALRQEALVAPAS